MTDPNSIYFPVDCYLLIGPPASGKTSASKRLARTKDAFIISTDTIRESLYGLEEVQGDWKEIEPILHSQILDNISKGKSVIIDATNCNRKHREVLLKLDERINWTGYIFRTPLVTCYARNKGRDRTVPMHAIYSMHHAMLAEPPSLEEGFKRLHTIH
tara:strand:+ start:109 stop:582 length:474 start_codon:yes stop_codon:yes gene_type:complete